MRSWVLGSGSRGNAILLETDGASILVDAGFPIRVLVRRLRTLGVAPQEIEAVIVTHEHTDHARSAAAGARKYGWRVYATEGTVRASPALHGAGAVALRVGETLALSTMSVSSLPVPHDAAAPIAVVAASHRSGARIGVAYDLGCATDALRRGLSGLDVLILESNHDEGMLATGPYPRSVVRRIAGRDGHLSNAAACALAAAVVHPGLARVVLAHLSAVNNDPSLAGRAMVASLKRTRPGGVPVHIAGQDVVTGPFVPRTRPAQQLLLGI